MNVTGSYTIRQGERILVKSKNIITNLGEAFFINRAVNTEFDPLQYIVLGTSSVRAKKTDLTLGNETFRKKAAIEVNWNTRQILMYVSCTLSEILNTSEIGTSNGDTLISHDTYERITSEDIGDNIDSVEITYVFDFSTSCIRKGWQYYSQGDTGTTMNHIYYIVEENRVIRIFETINRTMQHGYHAVQDLQELKNTKGAYYYDPFSETLYIRTLHDEDPNSLNISITTQ